MRVDLQNYVKVETPGITIVLPVHNAAVYINQLMRQIEANILEKDEIIIIDDNSEDTTLDKLHEWQRLNKKIRVLKNKKKGFVNALNLGVSEATYEWIARWDQDDSYSDNRLRIQREYLRSGNVAVFSDFSFISSTGINLGTMQTPLTSDATKLSVVGALRTAHPASIFSKAAFYEAGGYRDKDFLAEDISLWLRLSRLGNFVSIPELLLNYRVSPLSLTGTNQELSYINKRKVLTNIRIQQEVITNISNDWNDIFRSYDQNSFASRRKILLLIDLIAARRAKYKISPSLVLEISNKLLSEKQTIKNIGHLYLERCRRKKARNFSI
jgi:glycosyltransferase involved in cell wall biosynthesis